MQSFNIKKTCISRLISLIAVQKVKDFFEREIRHFFFFLFAATSKPKWFLLSPSSFLLLLHTTALVDTPRTTKSNQTHADVVQAIVPLFHFSMCPTHHHTNHRRVFVAAATKSSIHLPSFNDRHLVIHDRHLDHSRPPLGPPRKRLFQWYSLCGRHSHDAIPPAG